MTASLARRRGNPQVFNMYLWYEEMGLIYFPQIKTKEEFEAKFELLLRRLATEQIIQRVMIPQEIGGDDEH